MTVKKMHENFVHLLLLYYTVTSRAFGHPMSLVRKPQTPLTHIKRSDIVRQFSQ